MGHGMTVGARATLLALLAAPWWRDAAAQAPPPDSTRARLWVRPVASLVAPGTGQLLAGQDRGAAYIAAEVWVIFRFVHFERDGRRGADEFRRLAFEVARSGFTGVRRDTVFEYYEQMQRFRDSGEFDRDPGPAFAPEPDASTYNGSVWLLARRTFWPDPTVPPDPTSLEYQRALEFYRARAVSPGFRWSWRNAVLEHQVFRETIRRSDRALRRAQVQLGLLLANHLLSTVDAVISSRLAVRTGLGPDGGPAVKLS